MTSIDDLIANAGRTEERAVEELQLVNGSTHAAESRAADEVVKAVLLGRYRFNPGLGWLEWSTKHWDNDETVQDRVHEAIRQFADETERKYRGTANEAKTHAAREMEQIRRAIPPDADPKKTAKMTPREVAETYGDPDQAAAWLAAFEEFELNETQADVWLNLLSANKISALAKLCRGMDGVLTRASELDAHLDLVNACNGMVDLRTGDVRPHDPALLFTRLAEGNYRPGFTHPDWDAALTAIHPDVRTWFQTRIGQAATGHTPEDDSLVINVGGGENGKSAVMSAIMRALGSYAGLISHRVLMAQPGQHPTELMDLRGLRFALMEETPEEGRLDPQQLKQTIGSERITARLMRRDTVSFVPSHSLFINTNFRPQVDSTDHGTWRRLKEMPWPFTFRKPGQDLVEAHHKRGDTGLKYRLRHSQDVADAVLTYAVEGAKRWYAQGRQVGEDPKMVVEATREWRRLSDVALRFAEEHLVPAKGTHYIPADVMREAFNTYLAMQGKHPWSAQTLNQRLTASLESAGIIFDRAPTTKSRISDKHKQSGPPALYAPAAQEEQEEQEVEVPRRTTPQAPLYKAGQSVRVWMGLRFKTVAEIRAAERPEHLRAVGDTE